MTVENGLSQIVGKENVIPGRNAPGHYSSDQSFTLKTHPLCVVKPSAMEHVQAIVNWANETGTPLVPLSSGPPHFRGDTVPFKDGSHRRPVPYE